MEEDIGIESETSLGLYLSQVQWSQEIEGEGWRLALWACVVGHSGQEAELLERQGCCIMGWRPSRVWSGLIYFSPSLWLLRKMGEAGLCLEALLSLRKVAGWVLQSQHVFWRSNWQDWLRTGCGGETAERIMAFRCSTWAGQWFMASWLRWRRNSVEGKLQFRCRI